MHCDRERRPRPRKDRGPSGSLVIDLVPTIPIRLMHSGPADSPLREPARVEIEENAEHLSATLDKHFGAVIMGGLLAELGPDSRTPLASAPCLERGMG